MLMVEEEGSAATQTKLQVQGFRYFFGLSSL